MDGLSPRQSPIQFDLAMGKGNRWKDYYAEKARGEKWLARSVYKLEEIDRKHGIIRKGSHILDLGCYPGSWSQYCLKKAGIRGRVVGLDLKRPDRLIAPQFRFLEADILQLRADWLRQEAGEFDAVISDLAPSTTGIRIIDTRRSLELAERALEIALSLIHI